MVGYNSRGVAIGSGLVVLLMSAGSSLAETITYKATLSGGDEVPATPSKGTGQADIQFDPATKMLTYSVTYSGLSGPATGAHIHGPAEPGKNAPVEIPFATAASPITGSATLTDAQAADLAAGKLYINVHTAEQKSGEIRGWIKKE
jgi:CHRD domain